MSLFQRAFLYVTRKRAKTAILFLLLTVIATLVLSGAAIKGAVKTAQLNVRQALGGIFTMRQNTSDSSKWESQKSGISAINLSIWASSYPWDLPI